MTAHRQRIFTIIILAQVALSYGCVRMGFDAQSSVEETDGTDRPVEVKEKVSPQGGGLAEGGDDAGLVGSDDAGVDGVPTPGAMGDPSCAVPLVVDLAGLTAGVNKTVTLDFAGADLDFGGCFDLAGPARRDMVLRLINVTSKVRITCAGGGHYAMSNTPQASCPPSVNNCYSGTCNAGFSVRMTLPATSHHIISRPTAEGSVITLKIEAVP